VINDILDFSKIEAGKLTLESIDLDLRAIVEDVADLLAGRAEAKGLEMTCLVDGSVPEVVSGDPGRVRQILTNLVGNAVKFTGAGEVVVRLACAAEGPSDATVRFEVIDTGIGIDADAQADLFQAFSQGDGSTTRRYGGTGLGLAISKQLVELMGGEIGVVSAPGRGSTFWFTARFARRPARVDAPSAAAVAPLSGMRVLCADDNATSRVALARQMSAWGMAVDCAVDGPSALARLRSAREAGDPYRVVLVDHTMPGLDGFGLAGEVAGDAALAGTALVLLTPWAQRGSGAAAQEAGFAACVAKPVRRAQLLAGLVAAVRGDALAVRASAERPARRAGAAAVAPPAASAAPTPRADGPRVLIADDNIVSQKVTAKILEKLGYRADVVPNGIEAIEAASGGAYDVVLMDCQMPDVDGYQATAEIRRREGARSHTAIIAMTASALHGERERCLAAGMDGYISKPVHPQELRDEVERWVRAGSARARRSAPGA
jgi:CheY-like chemotaxis protein